MGVYHQAMVADRNKKNPFKFLNSKARQPSDKVAGQSPVTTQHDYSRLTSNQML